MHKLTILSAFTFVFLINRFSYTMEQKPSEPKPCISDECHEDFSDPVPQVAESATLEINKKKKIDRFKGSPIIKPKEATLINNAKPWLGWEIEPK